MADNYEILYHKGEIDGIVEYIEVEQSQVFPQYQLTDNDIINKYGYLCIELADEQGVESITLVPLFIFVKNNHVVYADFKAEMLEEESFDIDGDFIKEQIDNNRKISGFDGGITFIFVCEDSHFVGALTCPKGWKILKIVEK